METSEEWIVKHPSSFIIVKKSKTIPIIVYSRHCVMLFPKVQMEVRQKTDARQRKILRTKKKP